MYIYIYNIYVYIYTHIGTVGGFRAKSPAAVAVLTPASGAVQLFANLKGLF